MLIKIIAIAGCLTWTKGPEPTSKAIPSKGLLRHVVVVTFKTNTSIDLIRKVDISFKNLSKLSMVKGYEWGIVKDDKNTKKVKHVYVTTFEGQKEEDAYGKSPEHQKHIKLGAENIESVESVDYFLP
ncbi:Dabb family protein [Flectobacillus longus]|uniref:Dabb family protein n=1 Tax=Flectobacillus longus TaxID=2984207 RepID=A0ABT6YTS0_9BACT|nr:Dabb family protein [Flectobacillus longus]MDI9866955.1 Dabb family protein [Flectobacillus longus]MDI9882654.1 Dabb family protein [Flectobacillus longus]